MRLTGAGWTADPWPKGLFAKIADAANTPETRDMTPELEAMLSRAGLGGSFLVSVAGSTRGVDVARTATQISFRVLALASRDDYALATQLAAAAARVAGTTVQAEHGTEGGAVGPLSPDALLAQFDDAFFERNARAMGPASSTTRPVGAPTSCRGRAGSCVSARIRSQGCQPASASSARASSCSAMLGRVRMRARMRIRMRMRTRTATFTAKYA